MKSPREEGYSTLRDNKFATLLNKNAPHFMRSICCPTRIGEADPSALRITQILGARFACQAFLFIRLGKQVCHAPK